MKFEENKQKLIEGLKSFVNTENTDSVVKLCEFVEGMSEEHNAILQENTKLKDKIVDVVSGSMFSKKPEEDIAPKEKTFDEILQEAIIEAKKGE